MNLYDLFPSHSQLITGHATPFCLDLALCLDQGQGLGALGDDLFLRLFKTLVGAFLRRYGWVREKVSLDAKLVKMISAFEKIGEGSTDGEDGVVRENLCHLLRRGSFGKEV